MQALCKGTQFGDGQLAEAERSTIDLGSLGGPPFVTVVQSTDLGHRND
jgi:hypothetical protein